MTGIYKITAPDGKIYIGQATDISIRRYKYENNLVQGQYLIEKSLMQYGFNQHSFEVIHECEARDLNYWERYYQDYYDTCGTNGLNCILTGTLDKPYYRRPESCDRLSKALQGRVFSNETRLKMSVANKSRVRSKEELERLRERWIGINKLRAGRTTSDETKRKLRIAVTGTKCEKRQGFNHPHSKIVLNLDTGIFYGSAKHAAEAHNINYATLKDKLSERRGRPNKGPLVYA